MTPGLYKNNPISRLYGYKLNEYKNHPATLANDCPTVKIAIGKAYPKNRVANMEEINHVNPDCCKWLDTEGC